MGLLTIFLALLEIFGITCFGIFLTVMGLNTLQAIPDNYKVLSAGVFATGTIYIMLDLVLGEVVD